MSRFTQALALAATAGVSMGAAFVPLAGAVEPEQQQVAAQQWVGARGQDELELSLLEATPVAAGETSSMRFKVHNSSDSPVSHLQITSRRGDAVTSTAQAREQLAAGAFPYYGPIAEVGELAPGESRELSVEVPTGLAHALTLAITEPGAYPLLFTLTGTREGQAANFAEERLIFQVDPAQHLEAEPHPAEAEPEEQPHAFTLVYPLTSDIDIVPGDTGGTELILSNDNLAAELAPGGRLDVLLDSYLSHDLRGAGCVALDPALVDTVDRMAKGYTVNPTRPSAAEPPRRLRDSWFTNEEHERGKPGRGSADAAAWLGKLKHVSCTMTMPWANADADAVAHVNNKWLNFEAIQRGEDTIKRVLGTELSTPLSTPGSGTIAHDMGVPMLVADNSQWVGKAATFDASLGALLGQTGSKPQTAGYTNPELRYDYQLDSEQSRALSAAAALGIAARHGDVVAKLPNYLDVSAAGAVLDSAQQLIDAETVTPREVSALPIEDPSPERGNRAGSPYPDPAIFQDADITRVEQQARYTDELTGIMVNDPNIAMTRYGFTLPLRRDLLSALSLTNRDTLSGYAESIEASSERLRRQSEMLRDLRASVSLIPPGNVYTRVSESSPLLIVAKNGLPLPVDARLAYTAPDGGSLNTPSLVHIPAKGSITVSMTADLPSDKARTDLTLWLATPDRHAISEPINIAVQTRAGIVSVYGVGAIAALVLILAALFRLGQRRKKNSQR
ncbi:DUF6049 family protein [Corynebacterium sp.]|uniref:DUF6049 family protein n=1 Tax=Corynebacterium sp. TaxID=1720 RepID=UPI0026DB0200|nr:DUF6049 family protein [Corynebacterium sp.]MDO5032206.1 DUF6049 family protein [Corynebacterium sp.]